MYYRLLLIIKHLLLLKRVQVLLSRDFPGLYLVIPFIVGQALIAGIPLAWFLVLLILTVFVVFTFFEKLRKGAVIACFGIISAIPLQLSNETFPSYSGQALLEIVERPSFTRAGEIKFYAQIIKLDTWHKISPIRAVCRSIDLPWENSSTVARGHSYIAWIELRQNIKIFNPFSYQAFLWRKGIQADCKIKAITKNLNNQQDLLSDLRKYLANQSKEILGDNEIASLVLAMTIGLKEGISGRTDHAFKTLGLTHVLVVSGYHFALLFSCLILTGKLIKLVCPAFITRIIFKRVCLLLALAFMFLYGAIVGDSISTARALIAIVLLILALIYERGYSLLNSAFIALFVLSIIYPGSIFEVGTQLTFSALFGISLGIGVAKVFNWSDWLVVPIFATLSTQVICLFWFQEFSIWTLPANITLAHLLSFFVCSIGMIGVLILPIASTFAQPFLQLAWQTSFLARNFAWLIDREVGGYWNLELGIRLAIVVLLLKVLLFFFSYVVVDYLQSRRVFKYSLVERRCEQMANEVSKVCMAIPSTKGKSDAD